MKFVGSTSQLQTIIPTLIYRRFCQAGRYESYLWYLARQALLKLTDPPCVMTAHGKPLRMPLSHQLPAILKYSPTYDSLPDRLSSYIRQTQGRVILVDVGANIGDSVAAFQADRSLAIEANSVFGSYLKQNIGPDVTVAECLCSSFDGEDIFQAEAVNGTTAYRQGPGSKMRVRTVDSLVNEHGFDDMNVLKIDTDGHDLEVLAGAENTLKATPVVLFECYSVPPSAYLEALKKLPYNSFLLYSDKGHLMGRHYTSDLSHFEDLLYYSIATDDHYDILLLPDELMDDFHARERAFFFPG